MLSYNLPYSKWAPTEISAALSRVRPLVSDLLSIVQLSLIELTALLSARSQSTRFIVGLRQQPDNHCHKDFIHEQHSIMARQGKRLEYKSLTRWKTSGHVTNPIWPENDEEQRHYGLLILHFVKGWLTGRLQQSLLLAHPGANTKFIGEYYTQRKINFHFCSYTLDRAWGSESADEAVSPTKTESVLQSSHQHQLYFYGFLAQRQPAPRVQCYQSHPAMWSRNPRSL